MRWEADVPLAEHTRYRIGGPTPRFAEPAGPEELRELLRRLEGAPYRVLGGGANVLVSDEGVPEAVIRLGEGFDWIRLGEDRFEAGAATRLPAFVSAARRAGLQGYVCLEAVPGTVGGGLRMNAGSAEEWLWDRVVRADAMTPGGEIAQLTAADAGPRYRGVDVPREWIFLEARFEVRAGDPEEVEEAHRAFRHRKVTSQVYELRSVGSTWKNPGPPHGSAWQVVDRVGMRGASRGEARISEKHANFIVNLGDARAADVHGLMAETWRRAREELELELEPEIELWGFSDAQLRAVGAKPGGRG